MFRRLRIEYVPECRAFVHVVCCTFDVQSDHVRLSLTGIWGITGEVSGGRSFHCCIVKTLLAGSGRRQPEAKHGTPLHVLLYRTLDVRHAASSSDGLSSRLRDLLRSENSPER